MSDAARSEHLSIGEVLALVQEDFPDVTISKIRFLESQGLIAPERTGAGFRKFYEADIERLRWILRQQGDHFLPLKVIKKMLEDGADPLAGVQTQPTLWSSTESDSSGTDDSGTEVGGATGPGADGTRAADSPSRSDRRDDRYWSPSHPAVASSSLARQSARTAAHDGSGVSGQDDSQITPGADDHGPSGTRRAADAEAPVASGTVGSGGPGSQRSASGSVDGSADSKVPSGAVGADAVNAGGAASSSAQGQAPSGESGSPSKGTAGARTLSTPADVVAALQEDPRPPKRRRHQRDAGADQAAGDEAPRPSSPAEDPMATSAGGESTQIRTPVTRSELCDLLDVSSDLVDALEQFGFISSTSLGGANVYDEEAVAVTRMAARYAELGIEPRHLRMYKIAAEREAGMIEQLVVPLLKQRNPTARQNASSRSEELASMGAELHAMFLSHQLRRILGS